MPDKPQDNTGLYAIVSQALAEAQATKVSVDALRGRMASVPRDSMFQPMAPLSSDFADDEIVQLDLTCHNPEEEAPFTYDVFIAGTAIPFTVAAFTGAASAKTPATTGTGVYKYASPTIGVPTILTTNEQAGGGDTEEGTWGKYNVVLDNKIVTLTLKVQPNTTPAPEDPPDVDIPFDAATDGRKLLQVMPEEATDAGKLRLDLGYLRSPPD